MAIRNYYRGPDVNGNEQSFEHLLGLTSSKSKVRLRTTIHAGRGLFSKASEKEGTIILGGQKPLARGKNYSELIGGMMLQLSRDQVNQKPSVLLKIVASLAYPSNLSFDSLTPLEVREVEEGMDQVKTYVNKNAESLFELMEVDRDLYLRLWGVLSVNAVRSPSDHVLSLFGCISLMNHSCYPTCGLQFDDKNSEIVNVVTLRDMKTDEQLTFNYCEIQSERQSWTGKERSDHLRSSYNITCTQNQYNCQCI